MPCVALNTRAKCAWVAKPHCNATSPTLIVACESDASMRCATASRVCHIHCIAVHPCGSNRRLRWRADIASPRAPNLEAPDPFYEALIETHRELDEAQSHALNARLVLLLANHIGQRSVLSEAIQLAAAAGRGPAPNPGATTLQWIAHPRPTPGPPALAGNKPATASRAFGRPCPWRKCSHGRRAQRSHARSLGVGRERSAALNRDGATPYCRLNASRKAASEL